MGVLKSSHSERGGIFGSLDFGGSDGETATESQPATPNGKLTCDH
jgi:hypothetical protein